MTLSFHKLFLFISISLIFIINVHFAEHNYILPRVVSACFQRTKVLNNNKNDDNNDKNNNNNNNNNNYNNNNNNNYNNKLSSLNTRNGQPFGNCISVPAFVCSIAAL